MKCEETGRNRKTGKKKTPKAGRNWMILNDETGRNRKKKEETGRKSKKQEETERHSKKQ